MRFASVILLALCAMVHYRCGETASGMSGTMTSGTGMGGEGMSPGWSSGEVMALVHPFFETTRNQRPFWKSWRRELPGADSDILLPEARLGGTQRPSRSGRAANASVCQLLPPVAAQP